MNQQPNQVGLTRQVRNRPETTLAEFIAVCEAVSEMSIPADDPIFAYAERANIPVEFLELAWLEFRERHLDNPVKKYRDWRAAFRNAVRDNWYRLWRYADGQCVLTVSGEQAARVHGKAVPQSSRLRYDDARYENPPKAPSKPHRSRWNNFDQIDYREGVNEDGSF
jgi:hypothetical protein